MAPAHDLAHLFRVHSHILADEEEGGLDPPRVEDVQHLGVVQGAGAVIEGQGDGLGRQRGPDMLDRTIAPGRRGQDGLAGLDRRRGDIGNLAALGGARGSHTAKAAVRAIRNRRTRPPPRFQTRTLATRRRPARARNPWGRSGATGCGPRPGYSGPGGPADRGTARSRQPRPQPSRCRSAGSS